MPPLPAPGAVRIITIVVTDGTTFGCRSYCPTRPMPMLNQMDDISSILDVARIINRSRPVPTPHGLPGLIVIPDCEP